MVETDWTERRLCDDGGCTGVIGAEGLCKVCGHAARFWGDERRRGLRSDEDADRETQEHLEHSLARGAPAAEGEIAARRLCPDGACVGMVGADGCCKVCGRAAPDAPVASAVDASPAGDDGLGGRLTDPDEDVAAGDDREVCPDGSCIGLLGADRRCRVCGRAADDVPA